jgi:uncharacterized delta-60 repeat protein
VYASLLTNRTMRAFLVVAAFAAASVAVVIARSGRNHATITTDTFGSKGFVTTAYGDWTTAAAVLIKADGRIVTAGETHIHGEDEILVACYKPNGGLDTRFGRDGLVAVHVGSHAGVDSGAALAVQPDGKILIGGSGSVHARLVFTVVRLTSHGSLDDTFGNRGIVTVPIGTSAIANAVALLPDGRIILGGVATVNGTKHVAAARLMPNGREDPSFGASGFSVLGPPNAAAWGVIRERNGRLVFAGWRSVAGASEYMVLGARPNGVLDTTFGQHGVDTFAIGSSAWGDAIAQQPNGDLIVTGDAVVNGAKAVATLRLGPDGSLDRSFGTGGITTFSRGWGVNGIAVDSTGNVLLAGGGPSLVVLKPSGTPDRSFRPLGTFRPSIGHAASANSVAIGPNGRFVLVGTTQWKGGWRELLVRAPL